MELFLFWSCFFDDYPVMSPGSIAASTKETMLLLMRLLGFACSDEKLEEFAAKATVLGVEIDCSLSCEGKVLIRNKQGRAEEVCQALQQLLVHGSMSRAEYARIMGRLQYADAQVMGRSGRLAMAEIRRWAKSSDSSSLRLEPGASEAYKVLIKRLLDGVQHEVPCQESRGTSLPMGHRRARPTQSEVFCTGEVANMSGFSRVKFRQSWSKHGPGT